MECNTACRYINSPIFLPLMLITTSYIVKEKVRRGIEPKPNYI